jgi:hypothetical protein
VTAELGVLVVVTKTQRFMLRVRPEEVLTITAALDRSSVRWSYRAPDADPAAGWGTAAKSGMP